jgi:hypothetical protein
MQNISTSAAADNAAFFAAIANAERRALHSYFDQHVVADEEAGYITIDEGDYGALPMGIIDRIVHSVPGGRLDRILRQTGRGGNASPLFCSTGMRTRGASSPPCPRREGSIRGNMVRPSAFSRLPLYPAP